MSGLRIPSERPGIIAVAGESGSGKTTLARLMLGVIPPTEGAIYFNGGDITELSGSARREFRREVQPIMQDPFEVYNPFYKVDHVLMSPVTNFKLARNKSQARDLVVEALDTVGLRHQETLGRFPHQLSGGQRQRIMVARAILLKPRVIVADEPVSMVDASLRATILGSIDLLNKELGIAVIYITPRPDHGIPDQRQHCGYVPRLGRRGGKSRGRYPTTETSIYSVARGVYPQTRSQRALGKRDGFSGDRIGQGRSRMPIRSALPLRHGPLPIRDATDV